MEILENTPPPNHFLFFLLGGGGGGREVEGVLPRYRCLTYFFCFKHMCASFSYSLAERASAELPCGSSFVSGLKRMREKVKFSLMKLLHHTKELFDQGWL